MLASAIADRDADLGLAPVKRLRVALVYDDSLDGYGGIPQYVGVLGAALMRAGHDVTMLVGDTAARSIGGCPVHSLSRNISVRFNGNALSMPLLPKLRAIQTVIRDSAFDVIHVQVPYSPLMAGWTIQQLPAETALVGTFHVASEKALPRLGARLLSAVSTPTRHRFDQMICVSDHAASFARATFGVRNPTIVPNMVSVGAFTGVPRLPAVPTVVSLGALVPRKGHLELVEAFAVVARAIPEAQLKIAGEGPLRQRLARRIRRLGLQSQVRLMGPLAEREKPAFLRNAHVACFPSRYGESFGVVLLEAMAANGPAIVAGRNGGYVEVLAATPWAVVEAAAAPLARGLTTLLQDDAHRRGVAQAQHRQVCRYDADVVVHEILAVYQAALDRRRGL